MQFVTCLVVISNLQCVNK